MKTLEGLVQQRLDYAKMDVIRTGLEHNHDLHQQAVLDDWLEKVGETYLRGQIRAEFQQVCRITKIRHHRMNERNKRLVKAAVNDFN